MQRSNNPSSTSINFTDILSNLQKLTVVRRKFEDTRSYDYFDDQIYYAEDIEDTFFYLNKMINECLYPSKQVLKTLIKKLASFSCLDHAYEIFVDADSKSMTDMDLYDEIIDQLRIAKRLDLAIKIHTRARNKSMATPFFHDTMIRLSGLLKDIVYAKQIYEAIPVKSKYTDFDMIDAYVLNNQMSDAIEILKSNKKLLANIGLSNGIYQIDLRDRTAQSVLAILKYFFEKTEKPLKACIYVNDKNDQQKSSIMSLNKILNDLEIKMVLSLKKDKTEITCNVETKRILQGNKAESSKLFSIKASETADKPDSLDDDLSVSIPEISNVVMHKEIVIEDLHERNIIERLKKLKFTSNMSDEEEEGYHARIDGTKTSEEIFIILEEMIQNHTYPRTLVVHKLIEKFSEFNHINAAYRIFCDSRMKNTRSLNFLYSLAISRIGMVDFTLGYVIYQQAQQNKIYEGVDSSFISIAGKHGEVAIAEKVYKRLVEEEKADILSHLHMINIGNNNQRFDLCEFAYEQGNIFLRSGGYAKDESVFTFKHSMIFAAARCKRFDLVYEIYDSIKDHEYANDMLHCIMIESACSKNDIALADKIFGQMLKNNPPRPVYHRYMLAVGGIGLIEKARFAYHEFLKRYPGDEKEIHHTMIHVLYTNNHISEAKALYFKFVKISEKKDIHNIFKIDFHNCSKSSTLIGLEYFVDNIKTFPFDFFIVYGKGLHSSGHYTPGEHPVKQAVYQFIEQAKEKYEISLSADPYNPHNSGRVYCKILKKKKLKPALSIKAAQSLKLQKTTNPSTEFKGDKTELVPNKIDGLKQLLAAINPYQTIFETRQKDYHGYQNKITNAYSLKAILSILYNMIEEKLYPTLEILLTLIGKLASYQSFDTIKLIYDDAISKSFTSATLHNCIIKQAGNHGHISLVKQAYKKACKSGELDADTINNTIEAAVKCNDVVFAVTVYNYMCVSNLECTYSAINLLIDKLVEDKMMEQAKMIFAQSIGSPYIYQDNMDAEIWVLDLSDLTPGCAYIALNDYLNTNFEILKKIKISYTSPSLSNEKISNIVNRIAKENEQRFSLSTESEYVNLMTLIITPHIGQNNAPMPSQSAKSTTKMNYFAMTFTPKNQPTISKEMDPSVKGFTPDMG